MKCTLRRRGTEYTHKSGRCFCLQRPHRTPLLHFLSSVSQASHRLILQSVFCFLGEDANGFVLVGMVCRTSDKTDSSARSPDRETLWSWVSVEVAPGSTLTPTVNILVEFFTTEMLRVLAAWSAFSSGPAREGISCPRKACALAGSSICCPVRSLR